MQTILLALPLLFLAVCCAGCSDGSDGAGPWHGRDLDATDPPWANWTIDTDWGVELDYPLAKGETLAFDWFVMEQVSIHMDAHTHTDQGVVVLLRQDGYEGQGEMTAINDGIHSLFWENRSGQAVTLWYRVPDGYHGSYGPV